MNEQLWKMARRACALDRGRLLSADEARLLREHFRDRVPEWYIQLLSEVPLIECRFRVPWDDGYFAYVMWLDAANMISEDQDVYPGILARTAGFVPVGGSAVGSGDPYFIKFDSDDPPLWNIYHDSADIVEERFDLKEHSVLGSSLSSVFERCVGWAE